MKIMKIGYGSIQGFTHKKLEYNNQDFVLVDENKEYNIGLVADGCGSGSNSEVGAQLGLKYLMKNISEQIDSDWKINLKENLQEYSNQIAKIHSDNPRQFTKNFLLYTILGFVEKNNVLTIFSFGDGVIIIDDKVEVINQNNRPTYVNNELIGNEGGQFVFEQINFDKQTIIIGSDGVEDFMEGLEKGLIDEYENLQQFMEDENNFTNPIQIPKLLKKYSLKGVLKDDCTLIMIKK
jgi:serine/threonine protein phosphatase PrpC